MIKSMGIDAKNGAGMAIDLEKKPIIDDEPLFNIGVVSRMTGISMANLRAWERRYNFPEAKRTEGGHRLYSEYDLYKLQWVKSKIKTGMQTASAINLFKHQEQTNQLELPNTILNKVRDKTTEESHSLKVIKSHLVDALLNKNLATADVILGDAMAVYSLEDLIIEVISPTLSEIGEKWANSEIDISMEHLATNYLRHRLLIWMLSSPPTKAIKPILLACAPQEWHEGSLLILGTLLRRKHLPIAYLGQTVPLSDLADFIREIRPSLVVLVAMGEESARALENLPQFLPVAREIGNPIIGFGGRIFINHPELREKIPGQYLGDTFQEGINNIEQLVQSSIG